MHRRFRSEKTNEGGLRFFVDRIEVSEAIYFKALNQAQRLLETRRQICNGAFVRPWNAIKMQERRRKLNAS